MHANNSIQNDDSLIESRKHKREPLPFYSQPHFLHLLKVERKRSERSRRPFLLLLVDFSTIAAENNPSNIEKVQTLIGSCLRETDIGGWYSPGKVMGVVFTEVANVNKVIIEKIMRKIRHQFQRENCEGLYHQLKISTHVFPEEYTSPTDDGVFNDVLYPDLANKDLKKKIQIHIKSLIDFAASFLAIAVLSPVFLTIAMIIETHLQRACLLQTGASRPERQDLHGP